ncbi:TPA: HNH endonuclease signature motif containing protein [Pseudomonas aeruginosa]|uniref:HNH endonuclease signature motif containing protein n=1 Tax=Pseudomonas aeruginosa TaxID=287 RepID=UPI0009A307DF|nr:HNH endonuclease signature motif containing protein [Pseudomonas aeruginosa]MBG3896572.1 HNH endonuclease [Pseudomonas aeruginosa]MBG4138646.1 HNH endonuclease [Pseudomonas aeruginosa]MBG4630683.1 HNH endonuclease [Pseudomonas aeruginosa]RTT87820.1 HNH endonuclease [Pseudomonas aeruginosa]HCA7769821.1 HNH endonuclease [Pseudomonas aeruginosa]
MAQARAIQTVSPDSWRSGKNSTQRGYGYRWQQARARFLAKHPLCRSCSEAGDVVEATEVDHIIAHRGDQALFWDESNWQPLCKPCHSAKTQEEMRSS